MTCQILVSNKSNLPKAEIITVVDGGHVWTRKESMQSFIGSGGSFDDWSRQFSVVIVKDKTQKEVAYLMGCNESGERKYFFIEPDRESSEWNDLYLTGQVEREWSVIETFIVER